MATRFQSTLAGSQFFNDVFQRALSHWNRERLAPSLPGEHGAARIDRDARMQRLELGFLEIATVCTFLDAPVSGGSWNASYPLTNIKTRYLYQRARSTDDLATSSTMVIDTGENQTIGVVGLVRHNISTNGTVRIRGYEDSGLPTLAYDTSLLARGFVFQNPEHQFIAASVFDEIAHGLRRQHLDEAEIERRTLDLLDRFGLRERAHVHPFLLSGGQKRRLSVGTALVAGARVLALDEPTFGQDRARADELLGLLRDLNREGTTIIVVTHDMQLVAEYADRVAVMHAGRVTATGTPGDVFADAELIARAGLRVPPLARALAPLATHPELRTITRVADLPGGVS